MAADVWVLSMCEVGLCQCRSVGKTLRMKVRTSGIHTTKATRMSNIQEKPYILEKMVDSEYNLTDSIKLHKNIAWDGNERQTVLQRHMYYRGQR